MPHALRTFEKLYAIANWNSEYASSSGGCYSTSSGTINHSIEIDEFVRDARNAHLNAIHTIHMQLCTTARACGASTIDRWLLAA